MNWLDILKVKATATHNSKGEKKDRCAKLADKKYGMKSSAYKSGYMVQCRSGKVSKAGDNFKREKESGLHGWFSRRGGDGPKGWVSCQSCEDEKEGTKPGGRKAASHWECWAAVRSPLGVPPPALTISSLKAHPAAAAANLAKAGLIF